MGLRRVPRARLMFVALLFGAACGDNLHIDGGALLVSPQVGLYTDESGGTATFTVALTAPPADDVVVSLTSLNIDEGVVTPATLTFDGSNYREPHTVTIIGVDDRRADGDQPYVVHVATDDLGTRELEVTNGDDDVAGVQVSPIAGLRTTETGQQASFTVQLTSEPTADVTIPIASGDASEGAVNVSSLVFTPDSWGPQTVTVTGVSDAAADGDVTYAVVLGAATSADATYNGLDPDDVQVVNVDDVALGIAVTPRTGLVVSESGTTATFTVVLQTLPTANVSIPVSSSDTTEATVAVSSLLFTAANWNVPQTVVVTGANDALDDGDQPFTIILGAATSSDPTYSGLDAPDVTGTTTDDDGPGVTAVPASGLSVSESGSTTVFTLVLTTQPSANVTIPVSSSDTTEATTSVSSVVFTTANWNVPQPVTVTGVDDLVDDGDRPFSIVLGAATSTDASYAGLDATDVTGTTTDNDTTGVIVMPTTALTTTEAGGTATFTVRLSSQPTAPVSIPVSSSDTTEGTVSTATLTFDSTTWMTPQTVTVTGVDDAVADGPIAYMVVLGAATSTDTTYGGFDPADINVTNSDNDVAAGFAFDTTSLTVSEFRDADVAFVSLTRAPTANVTITLTSTDTTEGTVSPATLTFTPQNWDMPQAVTVTGVDDTVADGNITFAIVTSAATSADAAYSGLDPADLQVVNLDNDTAQVYVKARNRHQVSESGGTTTFRVRLTVQPTATVSCTLFSSDTTEGTVSPTVLTFQPNNFGFQTVTVTGVDDPIVDGDVQFIVVLNPCSSTDLAYQGSNPRDVAVTNRDND